MIGKFFDKILAEDEEITEKVRNKNTGKERKKFRTKGFVWLVLIFLLAFVSRLIILLIVTKPGYGVIGDVFHHWQIAYLSKTVGFEHGFLRLWDFKGMEFYWGLLHPLVLILGFTISQSVSILVPQMISIIFGSLSVVVVFLIVERDFNKKAAIASALFLSTIPTVLFHDTVGLQEPLGLFFLLLGIYLFSNKPFAAGFSWMLAGMVRSEYWIFGALLLLASLVRSKKLENSIFAFFGYIIPCIFYMKYMLNYTGNAIYPIYWNYMAIGLGKWSNGVKIVLNPTLQLIKLTCRILTASFLITALITLWKRPKSYLFLFLGFIYFAFNFSLFGFGSHFNTLTHYYVGFESWFEIISDIGVGKVLAFPEGFLGILAAILLFYFLPKKLGRRVIPLSILTFLVGLGVIQFMWAPIKKHYNLKSEETKPAQEIARVIANKYTGKGTILVPAGAPKLSYLLVYYEGISGEKMVSSFYSPFYYYKGEDPFSEWNTFREEIIDWLEVSNAELFITTLSDFGDKKRGFKDIGKMFILEEGKLFILLDEIRGYKIYGVKL